MNETPQNPLSGVQRTGMPPMQPTPEHHRTRNASIIGAIVAIIVLVGAWYVTQDSRAINTAIKTASAMTAGGDYTGAKNMLSTTLATYPNSIPLTLALADTRITEARRTKPAQDDQRREKASSSIRNDLIAVGSLIGGTQSESDYHTLIGDTYLLSGNSAEALAHFKEALSADQTNIRAMLGSGLAFEIGGDNKTAQKFYQKGESILTASQSLAKSDINSELFAHLGKLSAIIDGDGEKAKSYLTKAAQSAASGAALADAEYAMSVILYQEGEFADARTHAEAAIKANPESDVGYVGVLRTIVVGPKSGDTEKAQEYIWKAIQLNPTRALTRMLSGQLAQIAGNIDQAVASYGDAIRLINTGADTSLSPGAKMTMRSEVYSYLALAYQTNGQTTEAASTIKSAFQMDPIKVTYLVLNTDAFSSFKKTLNIK